MWLYPVSTRLYGINVATRWYRAIWKDDWLAMYVRHPLFAIEVGIVAVAAAVAWRRRRTGRDTPGP